MATDSPLVTVILLTCNGTKFLVEALESIRRQTYQNLEVIVIGDASSVDTANIAAEFEGKFRTIHLPKAGAAAARNVGVRESHGNMIAFMDHDAVWLPTKLERQIQALQGDLRNGMVFCGRQYFNAEDGAITSSYPAPKVMSVHDLLASATIPLQSVLVLREVLDAVGPFDTALHGTDAWDMCIRIADKRRVVGVQEVLVGLRNDADQNEADPDDRYLNLMKVLQKHRLLHFRCKPCIAAMRQSAEIISEQYYQSYLIKARSEYQARHPISALRSLRTGFRRYPQSLYRLPQRLINKIRRRNGAAKTA